jgi:Dockerin type I domain
MKPYFRFDLLWRVRLAVGRLAAGAAFFVPLLATAQSIMPTVRVVATSQSAGIIDIDAQGLTMNSSGFTTFRSSSARLWSEADGILRIVASQGLDAPGTTAEFASFNPGTMNDLGDVAFFATLQGNDINLFNSQGIWLGRNNDIKLVARSGDPAPVIGSTATFFSFDSQSILNNDQGQVAFEAQAIGAGINPNQNHGIWVGTPGDVQLVALEGQPAVGTGASYIGIGNPVLNNLGEVAFKSTVGPGLDASQNVAVFRTSGGTVNLIARAGIVAPGTQPGTFFQNQFSNPVINNAGNVAFLTNTTRTTFSLTPDNGIWAYRNGLLQKVAMTGDSAPGTSQQFHLAFGAPVLNAQGRVAFTANLSGPNPSGTNNFSIWSEGRTGALEMIAREGQQAPDLPAGFVFSGTFKDPTINSTGRVAFMAQIAPNFGQDIEGIWAQDQSFDLKLIALAGSPVSGSGVPGTINFNMFTFVSGTGDQDGRRSGFNDLGQVAFRAGLSSGIEAGFVSNIAVTLQKGDFNLDGSVNTLDVQAMLKAMTDLNAYKSLKGLTDSQLISIGDINGDGFLTNVDLQSLLNQLHTGSGSAASVPEPQSILLAVMGGLIPTLFVLHRRKLLLRSKRHRTIAAILLLQECFPAAS